MCDCGCVFDIPKGIKGDTGATGATGAAGANGTNGLNGTNGDDGAWAGLSKAYTIYTVSAGALVPIQPNGAQGVYHRVEGAVALGGTPFQYYINPAPATAYEDGDFVEVEYAASLTGGNVSICGVALTAWEAEFCEFLFIAKYDLGTTTWVVQKILVKTTDDWTAPSLTANISTVGGNPIKYYRDHNELVHFAGTIKVDANIGSSGKDLFTLPASYRPSKDINIPVYYIDTGGTNEIAYLQIVSATGVVTCIRTSGSNIGINDYITTGCNFTIH